MDNITQIILIAVCLCLEGLFSGGEIAYVSADINKIRQKAKRGSASARLALRLLERPEWFISTTLTGTNLCIVTSTVLATAILISTFGAVQGERISALIMIPTLLIMIVTRSLFQQHADLLVPRISRFLWISSWVMYPIVFLISRISRSTVLFSTGKEDLTYSPYITRGGLRSILKTDAGDTDIQRKEKDMVKRIFDFSDVTADEIMVPLSAISALPITATLQEAAQFASEKKHLRIPVYENQMFNIVGILHYFDLLQALKTEEETHAGNGHIGALMKPVVFFVPNTKPAKELLIEMEAKAEQMAVIVDEYGGVTGIVTIEDILEEIVGEIDDEYESRRKLYKKMGNDRYLFDAHISLEKLRQVIVIDIAEGDYETLAGFLLSRFRRIPRRKESMKVGNYLFIIEDVDVKSIREVLVVRQTPKTENTGNG